MTREDARYYLQSSGFSEEQIATIEQAFKQEPCEDCIHDGCKDCKYETYPEYYYPCCECKQNYMDEWQKKPHWIMKHRTINEVKYHTGLDDMGEEHTIKELIRYEVDEPYCSECGMKAGDTSQNYCCFCGTKMGGEQDG